MAGIPEFDKRGRNRLRPFLWGGAAVLLLLPAIAMRLGAPGVDWSMGDFIAMAPDVVFAELTALREKSAAEAGADEAAKQRALGARRLARA